MNPHPANLREAVAHLRRNPRVTIRIDGQMTSRCFRGVRNGRLSFGEFFLDLRTRNGHEPGFLFGLGGFSWSWGESSIDVIYHSLDFAPQSRRRRP